MKKENIRFWLLVVSAIGVVISISCAKWLSFPLVLDFVPRTFICLAGFLVFLTIGAIASVLNSCRSLVPPARSRGST